MVSKLITAIYLATKSSQKIRKAIVQAMIDYDDLTPIYEDIFETVGGNIVHDSQLDCYFLEFLQDLPQSELEEILKDIKIQN
jgi:hypothetical protein